MPIQKIARGATGTEGGMICKHCGSCDCVGECLQPFEARHKATEECNLLRARIERLEGVVGLLLDYHQGIVMPNGERDYFRRRRGP